MKKINKKNYILLSILIISTVVLTLLLSYMYINKNKKESYFYLNSNKITIEEFDQYALETSDIIFYIADKYDLSNEKFEKKLQQKLIELNLKEKLLYLDKSIINNNFLKKLKKQYNINIDIKKIPVILVIIDKKIVKEVYIDNNSKVDNLIEYEAFE